MTKPQQKNEGGWPQQQNELVGEKGEEVGHYNYRENGGRGGEIVGRGIGRGWRKCCDGRK